MLLHLVGHLFKGEVQEDIGARQPRTPKPIAAIGGRGRLSRSSKELRSVFLARSYMTTLVGTPIEPSVESHVRPSHSPTTHDVDETPNTLCKSHGTQIRTQILDVELAVLRWLHLDYCPPTFNQMLGVQLWAPVHLALLTRMPRLLTLKSGADQAAGP